MNAPKKRGGAYTAEEDKALAEAYIKMAIVQYQGGKVNKAALTRELQAGPLAARSRGSIDASWMNFSAAAQEHNLLPGLPFGYLKGYKPAPNRRKGLGAALRVALDAAMADVEIIDQVALTDNVRSA